MTPTHTERADRPVTQTKPLDQWGSMDIAMRARHEAREEFHETERGDPPPGTAIFLCLAFAVGVWAGLLFAAIWVYLK